MAQDVSGDSSAKVSAVRSREDPAEFVRQLHAELLEGADWETTALRASWKH